MKFCSMIRIEKKKIKRSMIWVLLLLPVILMWIPSVIHADANFDTQGILITPENNFFIQGFMGMAWFMIPATLIICTVLLNQTERRSRGILKMLSLPIPPARLAMAKFVMLLFLSGVQMLMTVAAYYISAGIASIIQDYNFLLNPFFVIKNVFTIYLAAIPMAAVFWMISVCISSPIASIGLGLASLVPSVLIINTKIWFAYPMSYPFYLLMVQYGRAAEGMYETQIQWMPWIPVAAAVTVLALGLSCVGFGWKNK